MKGQWFRSLLVVVCLFLGSVTNVLADDLDDGINKYTDDGIDKDDELGNADRNIKFIVQDAKSRANVRARAGKEMAGGADSSGNMNSVILGPGGNVRGDVIIIDQSKGDKTQVVE